MIDTSRHSTVENVLGMYVKPIIAASLAYIGRKVILHDIGNLLIPSPWVAARYVGIVAAVNQLAILAFESHKSLKILSRYPSIGRAIYKAKPYLSVILATPFMFGHPAKALVAILLDKLSHKIFDLLNKKFGWTQKLCKNLLN
jgi:hypothetical protein